MGRWMLHSTECILLWELDLRRKRGHVARSSAGLSAGVGCRSCAGDPNKERARRAKPLGRWREWPGGGGGLSRQQRRASELNWAATPANVPRSCLGM
jgi:hypothetical protein